MFSHMSCGNEHLDGSSKGLVVRRLREAEKLGKMRDRAGGA